jgi:hypothetical protein
MNGHHSNQVDFGTRARAAPRESARPVAEMEWSRAPQEKHVMVTRPRTKTTINRPDQEEPAQEHLGQRQRPESGRFRLQVDRQTKASYATFDDAEGAGLAIKKGYPIVQVSVYDATDAVNKIIELPAKE